MRRVSRKRTLFLTGLALTTAVAVIVAYIVFSGGEARAKQFATLSILQGSVEVQAGSGSFSPGRDGESLHEGDTVRTGPDGRAEIAYFDGSVTRLDFGTTFLLRQLATLPNPAKSKQIAGDQGTGRTWNRVVKLADTQSRFEVKTSTATATVRGTTFVVQDDAVVVLDGTVHVQLPNGQVFDLQALDYLTIAPDGTAELHHASSEKELRELFPWIQVNECNIEQTVDCGQEALQDLQQPEPGPQPGPPPSPGPAPTFVSTGTSTGGSTGGSGGGTTTPQNHPPVAAFSGSPTSGDTPLAVGFHDASTDPDAGDSIVARTWMFGDGGSSHATNPSHTYDAPGSFDVTLTVQDSAGAEDSLVKISYITVSPGTTPLVANPDTAHYTTGNTSTIHIDVLANDQGQSLSVTGVTQPASGTASASDGTEVTYTPVSGTSGSQIFEYTVTDAHDATATSDVTVSPTGAVTITLHWIGPPRDLDLHTLLPDDFGELAYYSQCQPSGTNAHPCPPGDWASQDHDETQAGTGNETHTITADGGTFHAGDYVVSVVNFACDDTFANSAASVTFTRANGAVTTINLPASASDQKTWNVGTMTLASNGTGTVSATNTFDATTGCGSSVVTAQSRHAAVAPGSPAETVADGLSEVTQVTATMVGDGAHLEWEATGDPHAIARFSTERFPETSIDGALGCEGDGTCDLVGLAAGTRYYVTIFPDWMLSTTPVEGVNAITVDIPAGTSSGDGTTTDPAPATDPAPTPDPTPTESTPPPPPSDPAATESTSPPPEPAPSDPPPPDPAPAPDGGTSA